MQKSRWSVNNQYKIEILKLSYSLYHKSPCDLQYAASVDQLHQRGVGLNGPVHGEAHPGLSYKCQAC